MLRPCLVAAGRASVGFGLCRPRLGDPGERAVGGSRNRREWPAGTSSGSRNQRRAGQRHRRRTAGTAGPPAAARPATAAPAARAGGTGGGPRRSTPPEAGAHDADDVHEQRARPAQAVAAERARVHGQHPRRSSTTPRAAAPVATVFNDPTNLGFAIDANALLVQELNASQLQDNAEAIAAWAASANKLSMFASCTTLDSTCGTKFIQAFGRRAFRTTLAASDRAHRHLPQAVHGRHLVLRRRAGGDLGDAAVALLPLPHASSARSRAAPSR